jgi:hypothetical protein
MDTQQKLQEIQKSTSAPTMGETNMANSIPPMFRKSLYQLPSRTEWTVGHYTQYQESSSPTMNSHKTDNDLSQNNRFTSQNLTKIPITSI